MVMSTSSNFIIKPPKTPSNDRFIELPQFVIDRLPRCGRITELTSTVLTNEFERLINKNQVTF